MAQESCSSSALNAVACAALGSAAGVRATGATGRYARGHRRIDDRSEFDRIHVGSLLIGFNQRLTPDTNLNFPLAVGVTEDAPDVQLTFSTPINLF